MSALYLGKTNDGRRLELDPRTLTTHAAIIGMTGSGKTGLAIALLEEAALSGVSAIAIDPKGDLANLLLTFPNLSQSEFAPWSDDPARTAAEWRAGLKRWDLDENNIKALKQSANFRLYTPAASHGEPINALGSFAAPPPALLEDSDLLNALAASTVANLLGLVNIVAQTAGKETALLTAIIDDAWAKGESLDLETIILRVVKPPFDKIGVFALESFFPQAKRFDLAAKFNALIASSAFSSWLKGEPLSIDRIFGGAKPTIAVFSIAHLGDKERMFFVTLLLNAVVAWMRSQEGSPRLRGLIYMDEIFGYFPPSANPPSKTPMMLLLKQARAFGLGAVLSTQNPVDLDYKGLSNIGAWFIGRLQTAQDRERVLAGLIGAGGFSGATSEQIAALEKRRFILKTDRLQSFETRWTMSYLKGPLTRDQIRLLTPKQETVSAAPPSRPAPKTELVRDAGAEKKKAAIEAGYEREKRRLLERRSRLLIKLDKEKSDTKRSAIGAIVTIGSSLLGAFFGSRRSAPNKIASAVKSVASAQKERGDEARVNGEIAEIDRLLSELEARKISDLAALS